MKVINIISQILEQKPINICDFTNTFKSKGHAFERIIDLAQRKQFVTPLNGYKTFYGAFGNKNFISAKPKSTTVLLNEKINNGNSHGAVDMLLNNNKHSIALSFKFFKGRQNKNFGDYDLSKMMTSPKNDILSQFKNPLSFGVVTNCYSKEFESMLQKSRTKDSEEIKIILADPEINSYFNSFVNFIVKNIIPSTNKKITEEKIIEVMGE